MNNESQQLSQPKFKIGQEVYYIIDSSRYIMRSDLFLGHTSHPFIYLKKGIIEGILLANCTLWTSCDERINHYLIMKDEVPENCIFLDENDAIINFKKISEDSIKQYEAHQAAQLEEEERKNQKEKERTKLPEVITYDYLYKRTTELRFKKEADGSIKIILYKDCDYIGDAIYCYSGGIPSDERCLSKEEQIIVEKFIKDKGMEKLIDTSLFDFVKKQQCPKGVIPKIKWLFRKRVYIE